MTAAGRRKLRGGVNSAELVSPPTNVRGESGRRKMTAGMRDFVGENRAAGVYGEYRAAAAAALIVSCPGAVGIPFAAAKVMREPRAGKSRRVF